MSASYNTYNSSISKGLDWLIIWLYAMLVAIGILCIFMVEYNPDKFTMSSFFTGNTNYSKQLFFAGLSALVAIFTATKGLLNFILKKKISERSWSSFLRSENLITFLPAFRKISIPLPATKGFGSISP